MVHTEEEEIKKKDFKLHQTSNIVFSKYLG